jgi:bifunctional non-homologous end joining protein LigD
LKALLDKVDSDTVRFSEVFDAPGDDLVLSTGKLGLDGVIGKRRDSV